MRRFALAASLGFAALYLTGCKSQQQVHQENAADLWAQFNAADEQYKKQCYDVSNLTTGSGMSDAISGKSTPAQRKADFDRLQASIKARVDSEPCKSLDAKRHDLGTKWGAAMNATPPK